MARGPLTIAYTHVCVVRSSSSGCQGLQPRAQLLQLGIFQPDQLLQLPHLYIQNLKPHTGHIII